MIVAVSRKFADAGVWNGEFVAVRLPAEKQIATKIGKMQAAEPKDNEPYKFDHLDDGFHDIKFYDNTNGKILNLVFARAMGEKAPVAVICTDLKEAQEKLKLSVQMSQMPGSGEEVAYDVYPSLSPSAQLAIMKFVGAADDEPYPVAAVG